MKPGKNFCSYAALAIAFSCSTANAVNCYYIPDDAGGSGGWSASTRWYGGRVPQSGDLAYVTNGVMRITAGDADVVSLVNGLYPQNRSDVVLFDVDSEFHYDKRILGMGKIVKNGTGALYLDVPYMTQLKTDEGIEVNCGELHLQEPASNHNVYDLEYGPLAVNSPGTIFLCPGDDSQTPGISGDGVITNTSATTKRQLIIVGNIASKAGTAYAFSGVISPNVALTFNGAERQDFLSDQTGAITLRTHTGTVGVSRFGNCNEAGSLGTGTMNIRGAASLLPFTYLYLGEGETTTKEFLFNANASQGGIIDGGSKGDLTLAGNISVDSSVKTMSCLYLDGSNTTRCTVSGALKESTHASAPHLYLTKRGTGTWRIRNNTSSTFSGGIAVEKGVLEADVIKESGFRSSLGYATSRQSRYTAEPDPAYDVPYAILLGDGAVPSDLVAPEVATLSYVGADDVSVTNRPIALDGAGRLRNDTSRAFSWHGIFSKESGDHVLALDGGGISNVVSSVTNGAGRITVVKEGSGTWRMEGDFDATAFDVRGGTLDLSVAQNYTWYRFNVRELWGETHTTLIISRFALLDEDGVCRNTSLSYRDAGNAATYKLYPGQWAFWTDDYKDTTGNGGTVGRLFVENGESPSQEVDCCVVYRNVDNCNVKPVPGDESTWFRIVMRVPADSPAITKYDICANPHYDTANGRPHGREAKSWSLDASRDGVNWTEIASVTTNPAPATAKLQWYSTRDTEFNPAANGYPIAPERITELKPGELDYVAVAEGATLRSDKHISVKELRYDMTRGGGMLEMFSFPETGTLSVTGAGSVDGGIPIRLPCAFSKCKGVGNLARWNLLLNGSPSRRVIRTTSDGLVLDPIGLKLIIR